MGELELPLQRIFLFVTKELLNAELRRLVDQLESRPPEVRTLIFEGSFHLLKADMVYARESEDVAVNGFHVAPLSDGLIVDGPAPAGHLDAVAARLLTFWNAIKGFYPAGMTYDRLVFHDAGPSITDSNGRLVGIDYDAQGHRLPGQPPANPAMRTDNVASPGTSATTIFLPPQVAITATLKTVRRKEWGRIYLPAGDVGLLNDGATHADGIGQIDHGHVITIRNAVGALIDGLAADGNPLVVWSAKHQIALSVDSVQVDSLFDVIRSRRYDRAKWFETHTLGA